MPCGDVTENIEIILDKNDRLKRYSLNKKTCGGAVGTESFLLDKLEKKSVTNILDFDLPYRNRHRTPEDHAEEFVALKHLNAVKSALQVYTGRASGAVSEPCAIVGVGFDGENTVINAEIDIKLMTRLIKACAHCGPG